MKRILLLSLTLLAITIVFGSCGSPVESNGIAPETKRRIILKESATGLGAEQRYNIIEVDSIEYLTTPEGGICPLVKQTINN